MTHRHPERHRLGALVEQRRKELGLSAAAAAEQAGFDGRTWIGLEKGTRNTQDHFYQAFEGVLKWKPGSMKEVEHGGYPTVLDEEGDSSGRDTLIEEARQLLTKAQEVLARHERHDRKGHNKNQQAS